MNSGYAIAASILVFTVAYAVLGRFEYQNTGRFDVMIADHWTGQVRHCVAGQTCFQSYPVDNTGIRQLPE